MAQAEFTNISYRAIAELCTHEDIRRDLVSRVEKDASLFVDLVNVMWQYRLSAVESELQVAYGHEWMKRYTRAAESASHHVPLPKIDWLWPPNQC